MEVGIFDRDPFIQPGRLLEFPLVDRLLGMLEILLVEPGGLGLGEGRGNHERRPSQRPDEDHPSEKGKGREQLHGEEGKGEHKGSNCRWRIDSKKTPGG